jgi:hypothetical protein
MITHLTNRGIAILTIAAFFFSAAKRAQGGACYCMMENKSIAAAYNKYGFEEYCSPSSPPKIYLHQSVIYPLGSSFITASDHHHLSYLFLEEDNYDLNIITNIPVSTARPCQMYKPIFTSHTSGHYAGDYGNSASEVQFDYAVIDDVCGGWWTTDDSSGHNSGDACDPFPPFYGAFNYIGDYVWTNTAMHCAQTVYSFNYKYDYSDAFGTDHHDWYSEAFILSNPFTDGMLKDQIKARLPSWPTNWSGGTGTASYYLDDDHICGSGSKMIYRLKVPQSEKMTIYTLQWQEIQAFWDTTNTVATTINEDITGTGDPDVPATGQEHDVDMPGNLCYIYETAPEIIRVTSSAGGGGGGNGGNLPGSGSGNNGGGPTPK